MIRHSRILIADGKPNTAPMLPASLRQLGHEVITVGLPLFVQSMALQSKPDAVVLGANLPEDGPMIVLRRLRAYADTAAIPVIALAIAGAEKEALLAAGVDECIEPHAPDCEIIAVLESRFSAPHSVSGAPPEILHDPARLAALDQTCLLDSEREAELDAVTLLASRMLNVPVALVSLVDHRRQFFKSETGLQPPWNELRETPVSDSFCQWVVSSREGLIVADARTHPVLRTNRAISNLGVIAYLGVPLSAPMGQPIGSFCAVDARPHEWKEDEVATMRDLAQIVDAHISLYSPVPQGPPEFRQSYIRAATRAAGHGFFGAARLQRRTRARLSDHDFAELLCLVERHSFRLIDLAADPPLPQ